MKKLLVIHAAGLSAEEAVRGDVAAHLSDLIADGSFARLSGAPDVPAAVRGLGAGRAELLTVAYRDAASFDAELGRIRERAAASGSPVAVLSEAVFISQHCFREFRPGMAVAPEEVPRLLAQMIREKP